jgi:hypothetical protein
MPAWLYVYGGRDASGSWGDRDVKVRLKYGAFAFGWVTMAADI